MDESSREKGECGKNHRNQLRPADKKPARLETPWVRKDVFLRNLENAPLFCGNDTGKQYKWDSSADPYRLSASQWSISGLSREKTPLKTALLAYEARRVAPCSSIPPQPADRANAKRDKLVDIWKRPARKIQAFLAL